MLIENCLTDTGSAQENQLHIKYAIAINRVACLYMPTIREHSHSAHAVFKQSKLNDISLLRYNYTHCI
jgi:hypothetical protein